MFLADLDCFLTVLCFLPSFADLCWVLLGFAEFSYCWGRAKRASKASERSSLALCLGFPWLPMLSLAHPCFFLLLSLASLLCMVSGIFFWMVLWHFPHLLSLLFLTAPRLLLFSPFKVVPTFLKEVRASRSLAKTGLKKPSVNKEISLLRIRRQGKKDVARRRYVETRGKLVFEAQ